MAIHLLLFKIYIIFVLIKNIIVYHQFVYLILANVNFKEYYFIFETIVFFHCIKHSPHLQINKKHLKFSFVLNVDNDKC